MFLLFSFGTADSDHLFGKGVFFGLPGLTIVNFSELLCVLLSLLPITDLSKAALLLGCSSSPFGFEVGFDCLDF